MGKILKKRQNVYLSRGGGGVEWRRRGAEGTAAAKAVGREWELAKGGGEEKSWKSSFGVLLGGSDFYAKICRLFCRQRGALDKVSEQEIVIIRVIFLER